MVLMKVNAMPLEPVGAVLPGTRQTNTGLTMKSQEKGGDFPFHDKAIVMADITS